MLVTASIAYTTVSSQEAFFRESKLAYAEVERRAAAEQEQRERLQQAHAQVEERAAAEREQREQFHQVLVRIQEVASALSAQAAEILAATAQQASGVTQSCAGIARA